MRSVLIVFDEYPPVIPSPPALFYNGEKYMSGAVELVDQIPFAQLPRRHRSTLISWQCQMDQHFAEMLADRPAEAGNHHGGEHLHVAGGEGASARQHGHDRMRVRSVGIELDVNPIDWAKFKSWLKGFLEKEGELIWRLKGVLWTAVPGKSGGALGTWGWGAGKRTVVQVGQYGGGSSRHTVNVDDQLRSTTLRERSFAKMFVGSDKFYSSIS